MRNKNVKKQNAAHDPAQTETVGRVTRRNFLQLGLGALSAIAAVEIGAASLLFLRSRSLEGKFGGPVTAGALDDFPNGSVTEFTDGNFFLVRTQDGGFLAVYRRCPHLGCTVKWTPEQERFYCPCHASSFDQYGDFIDQPVPRALDSFPVQVKDGMVVVDTSQVNQRDHYSPDQLVYG